MSRICFNYEHPISSPDPNRMDIACFIGFAHLRPLDALPEQLETWLKENRWFERMGQISGQYDLLDVPVPLESWEAFQTLFAGEKRLDGKAEVSSCALADEIPLSGDDTVLCISIDRMIQHIELPAGKNRLDDVAAIINRAEIGAASRVDTIGDDKHLVIIHNAKEKAGQITVLTNPSLGFHRSVTASNGYIDTYLGSTVRAFFAQGGRKCYVIRMGEPLPLDASESERINQLAALLWGTSSMWDKGLRLDQLIDAYLPPLATPGEPHEDWHGVELLLGLPDVTYVSLPDLPDLLSAPPMPLPAVALKRSKEIFVECSSAIAPLRQLQKARWDAPRCSETGYQIWEKIINYLLDFMNLYRKETQLVASLPLPIHDMEKDFEDFLNEQWFSEDIDENIKPGVARTNLQLAFPWLKTAAATGLPGQVELPEGALAGILANYSISNGAYTSAAGTYIPEVYDLVPSQIAWFKEESNSDLTLRERISVFAPTPLGIQLYSDVTCSKDHFYRHGAIRRLLMLISRAVYNQGSSIVFEPLSPATWRSLETDLSSLFMVIYEAGGLRGRTSKDAFSVVCNHSTMSQNDIDHGRLIANINFQPAVPVERINILLTLEAGGRAALRRVA